MMLNSNLKRTQSKFLRKGFKSEKNRNCSFMKLTKLDGIFQEILFIVVAFYLQFSLLSVKYHLVLQTFLYNFIKNEFKMGGWLDLD
jgi:hypothetical protein